jgi:hypothetical protein
MLRGALLKTTVWIAALLITSALARSDDHNVDYDKSVDFSKLIKFVIRPGKIDSSRQELNNAIVLERMTDATRSALLSKGLMEDTAHPDMIVEFTAIGVDYNVGPGGIANPINASRGDRGGSRGALGPDGTGERGPVDFSIGTLVVDVKTAQPSSLIWRGVYHANEKNSAKLGQKFPDDAKKLLAEYPGRKK